MMRVNFKNIGKIDSAIINSDGLSVISGNNCSGKTTLARAIYSLLNSYSHMEEKIISQKVTKIVQLSITWFDKHIKLSSPSHLAQIRVEFINSMAHTVEGYHSGNIISDKTLIAMVDWANQLYEYTYEITDSDSDDESLFASMNKALNNKDEHYLLKIINENLDSSTTNISSLLNDEPSIISLDDGKSLVIKNNRAISSTIDISSFSKIDSPIYYNFCSHSRIINNSCVNSLKNLPILRNRDTLRDNFKEDEEAKESLLKMIESSINGRLVSSQGELKFKDFDKNKLLSIPHMGSSLFVFALIARLIENSSLKRGSTLILDAPSANLNHYWYDYLAQILYTLYQDLGINTILVTTNDLLIRAIENLKNDKESTSISFYLLKESSHKSNLVELSDNLESLYDELEQ